VNKKKTTKTRRCNQHKATKDVRCNRERLNFLHFFHRFKLRFGVFPTAFDLDDFRKQIANGTATFIRKRKGRSVHKVTYAEQRIVIVTYMYNNKRRFVTAFKEKKK
jgi:hypothetical protein